MTLNKGDVKAFEEGLQKLRDESKRWPFIQVELSETGSYESLRQQAEQRGYIVESLHRKRDLTAQQFVYTMIIRQPEQVIGLDYETDLISGKPCVTSDEEFRAIAGVSQEDYYKYMKTFNQIADEVEQRTGRRVTGRLEIRLGARKE